MNVLRNLQTLAAHPALAGEYIRYQVSRARHSGAALRGFPDDRLVIGGFNGFSEYHTCAANIDERERRFLRTFPFGAGMMLDVGANLGLFSLMLARRLPDRTIHAFEPNPSTHEALRANLARNACSAVHAHALAVAEHDGEVIFESDPRSRATSHIGARVADDTSISDVRKVRCVTLDEFVGSEAAAEIALLKVDVEGHELSVFRGAKKLLESGRVAIVYFEVCPELTRRAGFEPEHAARQLENSGYQLRRFDASGEIVPASTRDIPAMTLQNWLAVRPGLSA